MTNDVFTLDENNNAAIRTVGVNPGSAETNSPSVFTEDENGNACIRVTGSGGGSVDESKVIVLSDTIPTADADNLGKFYCYKGTTNASYTHGYVYECVEGSTYYVANIAFEQSTFASESFEKAGQLIVDAGVADPTEVTGGTMTYALAGNLWSIVFTDENGNDLNTPYNIYTDDLEQDYDILPVIDPSDFVDGQVVSMTINNVSEEQGYVWERIDLQPAAKLGRYLAGWNCATGLAMTNPPESPYEYTTGDYFIVGVVATGGASNYKPNGSSYTTGVASSTVESESVSVNDTYLYDGTNWTLLKTGSTVTSVNGQTGDVTIGINDILPDQTGHSGHVLGTDGFVAGWVAPEKVQRSVMPQASEDEEGNIYQFVGTTDATYTNGYFYKCVSDGQSPATYSWEAVEVQASSGGLPSQTGNAGKFLVTDGTDANWGDTIYSLKIVNSSNSTNYTTLSSTGNLLIQEGTYWRRTQLITHNAPNEICFILATSQTGVGSAIGAPNSRIGRVYATKINNGADITVPTVGGTLALQIATMPTAGSTYEGTIYQFTGTTDSTYTNGHFYKCVSDGQTPATYSWEEVQLDADGTIPADRLASTTGLADGNYRLRLTMANGVPTLSWVAE